MRHDSDHDCRTYKPRPHGPNTTATPRAPRSGASWTLPRQFEHVLTIIFENQDYDAVLGTLRGDALETSLRILTPGSTIASLIGPPDAAFARARGMNVFMVFLFGLLWALASSFGILLESKKSQSYAPPVLSGEKR